MFAGRDSSSVRWRAPSSSWWWPPLTGHSSDCARLAARTVPPAWVVVTGLVGLWFGFVGGAVVCASRCAGDRAACGATWASRSGPGTWSSGPSSGVVGQFVLLPLLYLPLEHVVPHLDQQLKRPRPAPDRRLPRRRPGRHRRAHRRGRARGGGDCSSGAWCSQRCCGLCGGRARSWARRWRRDRRGRLRPGPLRAARALGWPPSGWCCP